MEKIKGLSSQEVAARVAAGQVNHTKNEGAKSYAAIVRGNLLTFFNFINLLLFLLVWSVGSHKNALFIIVVAVNSAIGLYQEIVAKRLIDKLTFLTKRAVKTYRDGQLHEVALQDLVVDDQILLQMGHQIPCDCQILEGHLEVNESLLTGESDALYKKPGDSLLSGSFVSSGEALCLIQRVGRDSYIQQLAHEAKQIKQGKNLLRESLDKVIRIVSYFMLPLGLLLFLKQFYLGHLSLKSAVVNTVAAVVGMFPQGLVLLVSAALTLGVIQLARKKVLIQELHTVDALARVDVLCLDKTGTLTTGEMKVEKTELLEEIELEPIMGALLSNLTDENPTALALRERFQATSDLKATTIIPFSSDRKYSGVAFEGHGTYYLGALQFLFRQPRTALVEKAAAYASEGYRVLLLAHSKAQMQEKSLPLDLTAQALILLTDQLREDARDTLAFFKAQDVRCMVISGDDPTTVSTIAQRVGLEGADRYVDASKLDGPGAIEAAVEDYQVFGRVSPQQKKAMVQALKAQGHTVAMTGDGVNDVLAFKEADCSIAMNAGSDAAKQAANLVLLENNFSAMPHIVNEGRRVVNNLMRTGSLFIVKVIFSILITVLTLLAGSAYPFEPIQLTVLTACFVGIPSFLLSFEADFSRVEGNFLYTLLVRAFPAAAVTAIGTTLIVNIGLSAKLSLTELAMVSMIFTAWNYLLMQRTTFKPIKGYRLLIFTGTQLLFIAAILLGYHFLNLSWPGLVAGLVLLLCLALTPFLQWGIKKLLTLFEEPLKQRFLAGK